MVWEPFCGAGTPLYSPNKLTQGRLMKIKWLVADVTVVGSPDICSGTCYFEGDFGWALFWPIQRVFVVAEPLCSVGTLS